MVHVLHISSSFVYSKLYLELVDALHAFGIKQTIFTPLRKTNINRIVIPEYLTGQFFSPNLLRYYHSIFFRQRIRDTCQSLIDSIDLSSITIIRAFFIYRWRCCSSSLQKILYTLICTIRNTDLNVYKKYRRDLIHLCMKYLHAPSMLYF